jgi:flavin reductase (DIM6/NTAB) family NADH-FMN oxidoreductase RutF
MTISNDTFRRALSQLAAGVSIVSTAKDGDRRGVTATAVCSVSAAPPTILTCVNTATGTCKMIEETGCFAINLLSEHHRSVADAFAGRNGLQGNERFLVGDWVEGRRRAVPILGTALAALECRVERVVRSGTHAVFFGIVEEAYFGEKPPLIYHDGNFHSLAFKAAADGALSGRKSIAVSA